jgi:hypothetical protein
MRFPRSNWAGATSGTCILTNDRERHAVAEVDNLLQRGVKLLERVPPFPEKGANRRWPLIYAQTAGGGVLHAVRGA